MFKIQVLSDQAVYDPNNKDVKAYYEQFPRLQQQTGRGIESVPEPYRAWLYTFYQYKTPYSNFTGNEAAFNSWPYVTSLYEQFPQLIGLEVCEITKFTYLNSVGDSPEGRQNKYVLFKDHFVCSFIIQYFIIQGGTADYNNQANRDKYIKAYKAAQSNYENWLIARAASLSAGFYNKLKTIAKQINVTNGLSLAASGLTALLSGGLTAPTLLLLLSGTLKDLKKFSVSQDGKINFETAAGGKLDINDQKITYAGPGEFDLKSILLFGGLAFAALKMFGGRKK